MSPSYIITPLPGGYGTVAPFHGAPQPYYNPNSPYPPENYFQRYRRSGSAGCVYGCSGE